MNATKHYAGLDYSLDDSTGSSSAFQLVPSPTSPLTVKLYFFTIFQSKIFNLAFGKQHVRIIL